MSYVSQRFPDCVIYTMPQRSLKWHEIRKGKITASSAGAWLTQNPITTAVGKNARHKAVCDILGSISGCTVPDQWEVDPEGPPPKNPAMWAIWNGIRQEQAALQSFSEWLGEPVEEVGFCKHSSGVAGCSPDALIVGQGIGFEGKAPLPATHVRYLLDGVLPDCYRDQIHFSMAVTGAEAWWFQSYCQGLPPFRMLTYRDSYTERMVEGIHAFREVLEAAREEISTLWSLEVNP